MKIKIKTVHSLYFTNLKDLFSIIFYSGLIYTHWKYFKAWSINSYSVKCKILITTNN